MKVRIMSRVQVIREILEQRGSDPDAKMDLFIYLLAKPGEIYNSVEMGGTIIDIPDE